MKQTLSFLLIFFSTFLASQQTFELPDAAFPRIQLGLNTSVDVAQSDIYVLDELNSSYSFGKVETANLSKLKNKGEFIGENVNDVHVKADDSLSEIRTHGIYLELFGREMIYSIGYEYLKSKNNHSFGYGVGTSILRLKVLGYIGYNQYSLSSYLFYEYGRVWGVRKAVNINGKLNPIMYSSKLDEVVFADKPPYYVITPSFSLGIFLRPKNSNFHYILNTYLLNAFGKMESFDGGYRWWNVSDYNVWMGLTIKYNFKIKQL